MNQQQNILSLHQRGWSRRKIARELGLDRGSVRKYVCAAKPATQAQTGSVGLRLVKTNQAFAKAAVKVDEQYGFTLPVNAVVRETLPTA